MFKMRCGIPNAFTLKLNKKVPSFWRRSSRQTRRSNFPFIASYPVSEGNNSPTKVRCQSIAIGSGLSQKTKLHGSRRLNLKSDCCHQYQKPHKWRPFGFWKLWLLSTKCLVWYSTYWLTAALVRSSPLRALFYDAFHSVAVFTASRSVSSQQLWINPMSTADHYHAASRQHRRRHARLLAFSFLSTCVLSFPPVCPCFYLHSIIPHLSSSSLSPSSWGVRELSTRPDRPWSPPSLLHNGYRGLRGRGVALTTHPHLASRLMKE